ncbi:MULTISPECIES: hypothetical protein [Actinomadura]|jgi:hypothetical protein|uniref:Uncharacterized protein n=1 Tax=Actinomadura geliboluensis TaxID=882440 RepID=A0A5S4G7P2_9ACTN|nr:MULTISPECIES: hypothetical protein [Actinomadura]QKW32682.1 hypothetical protein HUT06_00390 [Actinomadura sp. NAK00032]TMR28859.1 hypothetical protein ETD96_36680 [Actinomadura geliboluensis]
MSEHDARVRVNVSITVAVFLLGQARLVCRGLAAAAPLGGRSSPPATASAADRCCAGVDWHGNLVGG